MAPSIRSGQCLHVSTLVMLTSSNPHATPSRFGGVIRQIGSMSLSRSSFDEICCLISRDTPCHAPTPSHTPTTQSYPYAFIMADQLRGKRGLDIPFRSPGDLPCSLPCSRSPFRPQSASRHCFLLLLGLVSMLNRLAWVLLLVSLGHRHSDSTGWMMMMLTIID
jgi:hypothetical protein